MTHKEKETFATYFAIGVPIGIPASIVFGGISYGILAGLILGFLYGGIALFISRKKFILFKDVDVINIRKSLVFTLAVGIIAFIATASLYFYLLNR